MNETVLITGASSGIGRELSHTFARAGYHLILTCSKNIDTLNALSNELQLKYGIKCCARQCNGANFEEVEALFSEIKHIDILINNAGISYIGLLQDMPIEKWHEIISVNLDSAYYFCKMAIPIFLKQEKGRIINISSVWGNVGASMEVAYSASKGGLNSFTKALAKELAMSQIPVNAIACGYIDTPMNAHLSKEEQNEIFEEIPAGRPGSVNEVSDLALHLAQSPLYLTGQVITIDGGWT